jgi:hypothetical protein
MSYEYKVEIEPPIKGCDNLAFDIRTLTFRSTDATTAVKVALYVTNGMGIPRSRVRIYSLEEGCRRVV